MQNLIRKKNLIIWEQDKLLAVNLELDYYARCTFLSRAMKEKMVELNKIRNKLMEGV